MLDTSEAGGPPPVSGRDAAIASARVWIETARTAHQVYSPEIVVDGDTAQGIWAMQDQLVFENGSSMIGYGHYTETYVKQDGQWRISRSKLTRLLVDAAATATA